MVGLTPGRTVRGALPAARRRAGCSTRPFEPRRGAHQAFGRPPIQAEKPR